MVVVVVVHSVAVSTNLFFLLWGAELKIGKINKMVTLSSEWQTTAKQVDSVSKWKWSDLPVECETIAKD